MTIPYVYIMLCLYSHNLLLWFPSHFNHPSPTTFLSNLPISHFQFLLCFIICWGYQGMSLWSCVWNYILESGGTPCGCTTYNGSPSQNLWVAKSQQEEEGPHVSFLYSCWLEAGSVFCGLTESDLFSHQFLITITWVLPRRWHCVICFSVSQLFSSFCLF